MASAKQRLLQLLEPIGHATWLDLGSCDHLGRDWHTVAPCLARAHVVEVAGPGRRRRLVAPRDVPPERGSTFLTLPQERQDGFRWTLLWIPHTVCEGAAVCTGNPFSRAEPESGARHDAKAPVAGRAGSDRRGADGSQIDESEEHHESV